VDDGDDGGGGGGGLAEMMKMMAGALRPSRRRDDDFPAPAPKASKTNRKRSKHTLCLKPDAARTSGS
jgi:hypothetical protein